MIDINLCPKTHQPCEDANLCNDVNTPLVDSIVEVRRAVGGASWRLAETALEREIAAQFNPLGVNVEPTRTENGFKICPVDIINGETGQKLTPQVAALGAEKIAERAVQHVITDLTK